MNVSPYLVALLPPRRNCDRATRQTGLFVPYKCKINSFNFLLEVGIINSKSLRILKNQLSKLNKLDLLHQLPKCHGHGSVHHCRLRLGLSALKFQCFSYNSIPDTKCPSCGSAPKDPSHYFLTCPTYSAPRNELLRNPATILPADLSQIKKNFYIQYYLVAKAMLMFAR